VSLIPWFRAHTLIYVRPKQCLENLLVKLMNDEDPAGGELYHEVHLRHRAAGQEIVKIFGMLNLVAGTIHDHQLESWAASEKLFPWVAVAAPLKVCRLGILIRNGF
jgi:hypothetical protein